MRKYHTFFPFVNKHAHENLICCSVAGFDKAPPDEQLFRSNLPGYEIFYVTAGKGELIVENVARPFHKGDLILLNLHANHGYIADKLDPYEFLYVTFQHRDLVSCLGNWIHLHNPIVVQIEQTKVEQIFEEIMDYADKQPLCWETYVSSLIYHLLMHFYRSAYATLEVETPQPGWVIPLRQWIEQNLDRKISVEVLAEKAHISVYHFIREFKKHFNMSPLEYVILRRVARAKYLLIKSDQSIKQIGRSTGFPSHSSMIHNFKKVEGNTPSGFRKSIQGQQRSL